MKGVGGCGYFGLMHNSTILVAFYSFFDRFYNFLVFFRKKFGGF